MTTIDNVLQLYPTTPNGELEIRFDSQQLKKDWYMTMMTKTIQGGIPSIEQTINLITDIPDGYNAQQVTFVDGVKQPTTSCYVKKRKARTSLQNGLIPYRLALATENPLPQCGTPNMVRIKLRLSIHKYPQLEDWRIDFTFTKQLIINKEQIVAFKDKMFIKYDMATFVTDAPWLVADRYELEIEHIGKDKKIDPSTIPHMIGIMYGLVSTDYLNMEGYQNAIYDVATLLFNPQKSMLFKSKFGLKKLFNAVKEMNRSNYFENIYPNIQSYYATIKADGIRVIGHIHHNKIMIIGKDLKIIELQQTLKHDIIVDAEMVMLEDGTQKMYIFDVLYIGNNMINKPFEERINRIKDAVFAFEKHAVPKRYIKLGESWSDDLKELWEMKYPFETDGIIFNSNNTYEKMEVWKWKPLDRMSIDFLTKIAPPELSTMKQHPHIPNHTLMILFCGISSSQFKHSHIRKIPFYNKMFPNQQTYNMFPIQFTTPDNTMAYMYYHPNDTSPSPSDMDNRICEFNYSDQKWRLMRIRDDRDVDVKRGTFFGNNYFVASTIWNNFNYPLTFADIISPTTDKMGYFVKHDSAEHKPIRSYHSFIKSKIMYTYFKHTSYLVDLGGGKGQDMFRYSKIGVKEALVIDNDSNALSKIQTKLFAHNSKVGSYKTRLLTKYLDLNEPYLDNMKKLHSMLPSCVPSIMCNFAIHYFMGSKEHMRNIINTVNSISGDCESTFSFVCLNGRRVFDLLSKKKEGDSVDFVDNDITKFSIKRMYTSNQFMEVGQKIGMILPFSDQQYYEEYLVNIDVVIAQFNKLGWHVVLNKPFDHWFDTATLENSNMTTKLSDTDKIYTALHQAVVLRKNTKKPTKPTKVAQIGKINTTASDMKVNLPQIHKSGLKEKWFNFIKSGQKTIEGRLNRGTFSRVNVGDIVEFTKSGSDEMVRVKVIDIKKYKSFEDMFVSSNNINAALPGVDSPTAAVEIYHKIYTEDMIRQHGVVAAHIRLIDM